MRRTNFSRTFTMGCLRDSRKKTPIRIGFLLSTLRQKARGNVNIFKESTSDMPILEKSATKMVKSIFTIYVD